ncbi:MAG: hypothetical protein AB1765_11355 [Candidatus Hydrogenedentota bacterium]
MDLEKSITDLIKKQKEIIESQKKEIEKLENILNSRFKDGLYLFSGEEGFDILTANKEIHRKRKETTKNKIISHEQEHKDIPYPEIRFHNSQI